MAEEKTDWSARISSWRNSGKSIAAWCRDNEIGYDQFLYWLNKLERPTKLKKKNGNFVALKVASKPILVECNGTYLHVSSGFDHLLLREVVSALRAV